MALPAAPASAAPATFTVNSAADHAVDGCASLGVGDCTLRDAIAAANATTDPDVIVFAIPGSGVHSIRPTSDLPMLSSPVVVDATSQPGYAGVPLIELDGSSYANGIGFWVSSPATIQGFVINRFGTRGILLDGGGNTIRSNYVGTTADGTAATGGFSFNAIEVRSSDNTIGGTTPADRNVIVGTLRVGPYGGQVTGNRVLGNYIGTNATGSGRLGYRSGILLGRSSGTVVGGTGPGDGNLVSGNNGNGIEIDPTAIASVVQGNLIGTDPTGTVAIPNSAAGIQVYGSGTIIGGTASGAGNTIAGNTGAGISLQADRATVLGNMVGAGADGSALGNGTGIQLIGNESRDNTIGGTAPGAGNTIANNRSDGITILNGIHQTLSGNIIHDNGGLAIDLANDGVTANDAGDADTGPNTRQNFPTLAGAERSASSTQVAGTLDAAPGTYRIEVFASPVCDPSGYGEASTFLGHLANVAPGAFNIQTATTTAGWFVSALATSESSGDTSELSACVAVTTGAVNTAPIANAQNVTTTEDEYLDITLSATDPDSSQTINFAVTSAPSHGVLTGSGSLLRYHPEAGYSGPDSFRFTASDGEETSAEATVEIAVTGVNQPPVVHPPSVVASGPTTFTLDISDADIGSPEPLVSLLSPAANGQVGIDGIEITYTPNASYTGPDAFELRVDDTQGGVTDVAVEVTVTSLFSTSFDLPVDPSLLRQGALRWCGPTASGKWIDPTVVNLSCPKSAVANATTASGSLVFQRVGYTLPYVWTAPGLIPSTGAIVIDADLTISALAVSNFSKMGWTVRSGADLEPRLGATNSPFASSGPLCSSFQMTAENGSIKASFGVGAPLVLGAVPGTHQYRLQYVGGRLSLFVDGELTLGPILTPHRPTAAWFGSPWLWDRMGAMRLNALSISSPAVVDSDGFGGDDGTQYYAPTGGLPVTAMTDADGDGLADLCEGTDTDGPRVSVEQVTDPVFETPKFTFVGTLPAVLNHGETFEREVPPGNVVIQQAPTKGWPLTDIDCGGRETMVDLAAGVVTVPAANGERIYCRYTNGPGNVQNELPPGWATTDERICPPGRWVPTATVICGGNLEEPPAAPVMVDDSFLLTTGDTARRTFPFMYTLPGVVPVTTEHTVVEMTVRFPTIRNRDAMVRIAAHGDPTPVGTNLAYAYGAEECASPELVDGILQLPGASVYLGTVRPAVPILNPASPHRVRMQWSGGWMFVSIDGVLAIGPIRTDIRPDTIDIGNPRFLEFEPMAAFSEIRVGDIVITTPSTVDRDGDGIDDAAQDWSQSPVVPTGFEAMRNDSDGDGASDLCDARPTTADVGTLIVEKQTVLQGDLGEFQFTGPISDTLSDDERATRQLAPGVWAVGEKPQTGWALVKVVCDGRVMPRESNGTVRVSVSTDRTTTCVFTNDRTGTLRIVKETDVDPLGQLFRFNGSVSAVITGAGAWSIPVWPGKYTVYEQAMTDWSLQALTCVDPSSNTTWSLTTATAQYDVSRGETVTCTYSNSKIISPAGFLEIEKVTDPADSSAAFSFTGSRTATLRDGGIARFRVAPGVYSIFETAQVGWQLENVRCTDVDSSGDVSLRRAVYRIDAGETVRCTFTNRRLARLVIIKETVPSPSTANFDIVGDVSGTIRDKSSRSWSVPGDTPLTFREVMPASWTLTSAECPAGVAVAVDLSTASVTVTVPDQSTVICTLRNTFAPPASVTIVKETEPSTAGSSFGFSGFLGGFTLAGASPGNERTFSTNLAGDVVEQPVPGWTLSAIDCAGHRATTPDVVAAKVSIAPQPGDVIRCTFTNRRDTGTIEIEKQTRPAGDPTEFEFTGVSGDNRLVDDEVVRFVVPTGTHPVRELVPANWVLADLSCTDPSNNPATPAANTVTDTATATATIALAKDETVHCTFTNDALGSLTVVKEVPSGSSSPAFDFASTPTGGDSVPFSLRGGESNTFRVLGSGTAAEVLPLPAGWQQVPGAGRVDCVDPTGDTVEHDAAGSAAWNVAPGEQVTCTFRNEPLVGSLVLTKQTMPDLNAGTGPAFHFDIDGVGGPDLRDDESSTSIELTPGTHVITELVPSRWRFDHALCRTGDGPDMRYEVNGFGATISAGMVTTCTVWNETSPDVAVTKTQRNVTLGQGLYTDGEILVALGDTVDYRIRVENLGGAPATDVVVVDTLPDGMRWVGLAPSGCSQSGNAATCRIAELAGPAIEFVFRARVHFECFVVGTRFADDLNTTGLSAEDVAVLGRGAIVRDSDDGHVVCGAGGADDIRANGGDDAVWGHGPSTHAGEYLVNNVRVTSANPGVEALDSVAARVVGVPDGADVMTGGLGADVMQGQAGGDTMAGNDGADEMNGNADDDTMNGNSGNDSMLGSAGADTMSGDAGNDDVNGGADDDPSLSGGAGNDTVSGDDGNDTAYGDAPSASVATIAGSDFVRGGAGADYLYGDNGNDCADTAGAPDRLVGDDIDIDSDTSGEGDSICGQGGHDSITQPLFAAGTAAVNIQPGMFGVDGIDTMRGGYGDDTLFGGDDGDRLFGQDGRDELGGGGGGDLLNGSIGDDWLHGDEGNDVGSGGPGNDLVSGDGDDDEMSGDGGNDHVSGDGGNDIVNGGTGDDRVTGGSGSDTLNGDGGNDTFGAPACGPKDTTPDRLIVGYFINIRFDEVGTTKERRRLGIYGEGGNDRLLGGIGCDDLFGGLGSDALFGGDDADRMAGDDSFSPIDEGGDRDRLEGGAGDDLLLGQGGNDSPIASTFDAGKPSVTNEPGLYGGSGIDRLHGGIGIDRLEGGGNNDFLKGGASGSDFCSSAGSRRDVSCELPGPGNRDLGDREFQWVRT